jgi:hypothetical protein
MVRVKEEVICLYGMVVGMDDYDIVLRVWCEWDNFSFTCFFGSIGPLHPWISHPTFIHYLHCLNINSHEHSRVGRNMSWVQLGW